jgi:5-methylcytosine-specific restriction endonuclease McrA
MKPQRAAIVASLAFIQLFKKARARLRNPKRKWCKKRRHRICAANAHVGDVLRSGHYNCYPCWLTANKKWAQSPAARAYREKWRNSARGKAWFKAYNQSARARALAQAQHNARRAKKWGVAGAWTADEFLALCAKYGNRCLCCGRRDPLSPDHVVPISLGGPNAISNLQPLCCQCNRDKYTTTTDYRNNPHSNCLLPASDAPEEVPTPEHLDVDDIHAGIF